MLLLRPTSKKTQAALNAFRSKSAAVEDSTPATAAFPGPGAYHEGMKTNFPELDGRNRSKNTAPFMADIKPRIISAHPDLPTADEVGRTVLGDFANQVGHVCLGTKGLACRDPGPGEYEQNREEMWDGGLVGAAGSYYMQAGSKRHEWVPEEERRKPGPGAHNPIKATVLPDKLKPCTGAFNSQTQRGVYSQGPAPGPCYYTPTLPKPTKSFRMKNPDIFCAGGIQ